MPTFSERLNTAVGLVEVDSEKLHDIIHGPAAGAESTVSTDNGPVKTIARAISEIEGSGGGGGATTLDGLSDVDVPSPSADQILKFNSTTSRWIATEKLDGGNF